MTMTPQQFFTHLWTDYVLIAPNAAKIRALFESRGETVANDHVAFRTLNLSPIGLGTLEKHLLALGYQRYENYQFAEKKLNAWGYVHPSGQHPRIFLSELLTEQLSPTAQTILKTLTAQVNPAAAAETGVLWSGRLWSPIRYEDYQTLLAESEYAAWFAALGFHANHFTVSINGLEKTPTVAGVLDVVEAAGFPILAAGGRVKGTPAELLEQGSTLADQQIVTFADGVTKTIPTCYYEFALRSPDASGHLYDGFVAASADKIFESTDVKEKVAHGGR